MYSKFKAKQVWGSPENLNYANESVGIVAQANENVKNEKRIQQRLPTVAAEANDHHRMQIKSTFSYPSPPSPLQRKPRLMRRPKNFASDELSTDSRTLYTITASSKSRATSGVTATNTTDLGCVSSGAISQVCQANLENVDTVSKPTNFATIFSQQSPSFLPRISLTSQSPMKTITNFGGSTGLKISKSRPKQNDRFPNIDASSHARRNWVNAELKVFPVWHELMKTNTDVHNRIPPVSTIDLEKMVEELRMKKNKSPDRMCFSHFAAAVRSANSLSYKEHVSGRSTFSPLPGPNDCYRHGVKEEYTYSTDEGRYSSKF